MQFQVELTDIRPVKALTFSLDLDRNAPLCIVGRNGAGKTTLAKAIMNFARADTFGRTNSNGALVDSSRVRYILDGASFEFTFDPAMATLNSRQPVPQSLRSQVAVELPIPHGQRFSYFQALFDGSDDIGRAIYLEDEVRPDALIGFLTRIYSDARLEDLREVKFSRGACCFYRVDGRYVREDSFSSGEFFLVNLYRRLQSGPRLVFIDEIDISLDAAAQARLVAELRRLCAQFSVNVVFTSHSLALMQTLGPRELLYLEAGSERSLLEERSFAFVKSVMFGFKGWDRYILVEDEAAKLVVQHLIDKHCLPVYNRFFIIEVGGAGQVISLLQRNRVHEFLAPANAVIAILDGDQVEQAMPTSLTPTACRCGRWRARSRPCTTSPTSRPGFRTGCTPRFPGEPAQGPLQGVPALPTPDRRGDCRTGLRVPGRRDAGLRRARSPPLPVRPPRRGGRRVRGALAIVDLKRRSDLPGSDAPPKFTKQRKAPRMLVMGARNLAFNL
jgi:ABC-type dipeptide/oligopeptide/nickel transport system ATPase subunit